MTNFSISQLHRARQRIKDTINYTPLVPSIALAGIIDGDIFLKLELTQPIGVFKLRGAANAIFALAERERKNNHQNIMGVTCCSTGNHGRGVAYAAKQCGIPAVICMSSLVPQTKIDGIKALGAEVRIIGTSQDDAMAESKRLVEEEGMAEISPFDDPFVIAGQGTIGLELVEQCPKIKTVLVPVSGGGLVSGIAAAVRQHNPNAKIIGISMDSGAAMRESLQVGHPIEVQEVASLADSLGGGIGLDNRISFSMCKQYLDDLILVSEEEIYHALQVIYYKDRLVCEGASAVGIAALLANKIDSIEFPAVTIITGRNIDMKLHADIMQGRDIVLGNTAIKGRPYDT